MTERLTRRSVLKGGAAFGLAAAGVRPLLARGGIPPGPMNPSGAQGLGPGGALLKPDSLPYPHLPPGTDTIPQIEHVVVLMMENHSFDDHLGMLGRGDGLTLGSDGQPVNYNPDPAGGYVRSYHLPNTCNPSGGGITQTWDTSHICWDNGTNMGFVKGCTPAVMGYWEESDLPFYYGMTRQFPIGDRYFCSVMAQTFPNRRFLIAATALGDVTTDFHGVSVRDAPNGTIFDRLNEHGISWKDYTPDEPTAALFLAVTEKNPEKIIHDPNQFIADAKAGTLPAFSIIDPYGSHSEEDGDITEGEAYAARMIDALLDSPNWDKSVLFWVYDEHGGWYDHVPPAPAVKPDNVPPEIDPMPKGPDQPGAYDYTGFRVPCCVVSAWSKRDYVSHQFFDHTSILKFVETKWNLPALTYRDANANNMLDFFDFAAKTPPFADPPVLPAPKNPFVGLLPLTSSSPGFHPICQPLADSSLPPAKYMTASKPPNADALIAAHTAAALDLIHPKTGALPEPGGSDIAAIAGGSAGGALLLGGAAVLALRRRRSVRPDSEGPDSEGPDSEGPDSEGPDSEGPDSEGPDSEGPDSEGPDSAAPGSAADPTT